MRRRDRFAPFLLATTLAIGFMPIWGTLFALIASTMDSTHPRPGLVIRHDGTPLLRYYTAQSNSWHYEDLHAAPVDVSDDEDFLPLAGLAADIDPSSRRFWLATTASWSQRVREFSDARNTPTNWYIISDGQQNGTAYLVGYDASARQLVGYLGREGFRVSLPPEAERFPFAGGPSALSRDLVSLQHWQGIPPPAQNQIHSDGKSLDWRKIYLRSSDNHLYEVDLKARTTRSLLAGETIVACSYMLRNKKDGGDTLFVRTPREVLVLDTEYKVLRRYALPTELSAKHLSWSEIAPGKTVAFWDQTLYDPYRRTVDHLAWFDEQGTVTRREQISHADEYGANPLLAVAIPSLAIDAAAFGFLLPMERLAEGAAATMSDAYRLIWLANWSTILLTGLISAALAICCYRRQVRFVARPQDRILWTLFVFMGGLPGWIGYRYGRRWPVLESCPHCRTTIPRDGEECARCQREMPRPVPIGTEIFAT